MLYYCEFSQCKSVDLPIPCGVIAASLPRALYDDSPISGLRLSRSRYAWVSKISGKMLAARCNRAYQSNDWLAPYAI